MLLVQQFIMNRDRHKKCYWIKCCITKKLSSYDTCSKWYKMKKKKKVDDEKV